MIFGISTGVCPRKFLWCDKLKLFGFPIHGCIDGYNRKIIWLTDDKSNKDPYTVGKLY